MALLDEQDSTAVATAGGVNINGAERRPRYRCAVRYPFLFSLFVQLIALFGPFSDPETIAEMGQRISIFYKYFCNVTCNFSKLRLYPKFNTFVVVCQQFFLNAGPHSTPIIDAKCFGLIAHSNLFRERQVNQMKGPGTVSILVEFPSVSFPIKKGRGRPKTKKKKKK